MTPQHRDSDAASDHHADRPIDGVLPAEWASKVANSFDMVNRAQANPDNTAVLKQSHLEAATLLGDDGDDPWRDEIPTWLRHALASAAQHHWAEIGRIRSVEARIELEMPGHLN